MEQDGVQGEDAEQADEAQFLANRNQNHVGVDRRHQPWASEAQARAGGTSGGKAPEALRQVISATNEVVPRRQPHRDTTSHSRRVLEVVGRDEGQRDGAGTTGNQQPARPGQRVEHEEEEEQTSAGPRSR